MILVPLVALILHMQQTLARGDRSRCLRPGESVTRTVPLREAVLLAQCHLGCMEKHMNVTSALMMAMRESDQWPYLTTSDILLYGDCAVLEEVMECRRGCLIRSRNATAINRTHCRTQCVSECETKCGDGANCATTYYSNSTCPLDCKKSLCGGGCVLAGDLPTSGGSVPLTPQHPLTLVRAEDPSRPLAGGFYSISLGGEGKSRERVHANVTAFIARIETSGTLHYFPLTNLDDVLDLGQFSCETVNISFSAVNQHTMSDFSPAIELTVYGDTGMPSQLLSNSIHYEWVEDVRPQYSRAAVVNISWEPPEGAEFINSYEILFFSQTEECGGERVVINFVGIGRKATYFVWMPIDMLKYKRMPRIGCIYHAQIRALPCLDESCGNHIQIITVDERTMKDNIPPTMNLTCHKYVNSTSGLLAVLLQWEVKNSSDLLSAIEDYNILVKLVDTQGEIPTLLDARVLKHPSNGSRMVYLVHGQTPDPNENHMIIIRVTPSISEEYNWRQIPAYQECRVNIYPQPPTVPGATVSSFSVNHTAVFLNLSLLAPSSPFGQVRAYEVILVRESVPEGEDPLTLSLVRETGLEFDNGMQNGILSTENVDSAYRHIDQDTLCLFLHIRARNEFLWSDWSEPILLERYPNLYSNCSALEEPQSEVGLYTYVLVSLCLVVLAVATLLTLFGASHVYRQCRLRKEMRRACQDAGYENPIFRRYDGKRRSSGFWLPMDAPKADDWELPSTSILITDEGPLGEGCFGTVHRGVVKGPIIHSRMMKNAICMNVAVKLLKKTAMGSEKSDFFTEIDTMKLVAEGNNPHVVNMIGCVTLQEPICLVTEFVKYGDLLSYLIIIRRLMMADQTNGTSGGARTSVSDRDSPMINSPTFPLTIPNTTGDVARAQNDWGNGACGACGEGSVDGDCSESGVLGDSGDSGACGACGEGEPLSPVSQCASYDRLNPYANLGEVEPVNLISFAYQIASGMEYLSSLGIIHRDLACRNILVGEEKQLKISDFGMARATVDEVYIKSSKGKLPWKWMAMESILTREFTTASDVWAFGVTLWEIATLGEFPYPTIANGDLLEYLRKGNRLEFPDDCSQDIYDIMLKCWDEMPEKRPTFSTLKTMFAEMLQESNSYIQLDNVSSRIPYYVNSHVLEELKTNGKKLKLEEERVNEERPLSSTSSSSSEHALSSAACTPPDYSDYELLKNSAVDAPPLEEQQQQDPPPVPPNLYVDTPTKRNERKGSSSTTLEVVEDQHHRHTRPSHLSLDLDAAAEETEV